MLIVMNAFDPTAWNFVRLGDFTFPGCVAVYEYGNHATVDGRPNFLRINAYLSQDGEFVTIWRGLLEPLFTRSRLGFVQVPDDFDFRSSYQEDLFRGYIESHEAAQHILKALRLDTARPSILSTDAGGKLRCDLIAAGS